MSGKKFVSKLKIMGYPGAEKLLAENFDWMFDCEEVVPFLDWFCDNVDPANLLDPQELTDYAQLEASGETLLDGDLLKDALGNIPVQEKAKVSNEQLKEEVRFLKEDLEIAERHLTTLKNQRYIFSTHFSVLNQQNNKLSDTIDQLQELHDEKVTDCLATGDQLKEVFEDLTLATNQLGVLYAGFEIESTDQSLYLSQMDLTAFQLQEEEYNTLLKTFIKNQFFEGIDKVSSVNTDDFVYRLNVKKPCLNYVREADQTEYIYQCQELCRLCDIYPETKLQQIDILTQEHQADACVNKVCDVINSVVGGRFPTDTTVIHRMQREVRAQLGPMRQRAKNLREMTIAKLVNECAGNLAIKTISGNCNLKLIRQQYITSKLDKVLHLLVNQRARCELLSLLYELELESHQETNEVLGTIHKMIDNDQTNLEHTLETLPQLATMQMNLVNDSQESMCSTLRSLLVNKNEQNVPNYCALIDGAKTIRSQLDNVEERTLAMRVQLENRWSDLEQLKHTLETAVFSDNSSGKRSFTQYRILSPIVGSTKVLHTMAQLKRLVTDLEDKVFGTISDYNAKQKLCKHNEMTQIERKLFHLFYTSPEKLEKIATDLETLIQGDQTNDEDLKIHFAPVTNV